jgi:CRP/FNR family transcriptional regulator, cyclic AMP receptor protein
MNVLDFPKRTQIFEQGDYGHEAYRILKGSVEISIQEDHSKVVLAKLGVGGIFGEMGMIEHRPRSATASALEDLSVEVITEEDFNAVLEQGGAALVPYLTTIFERLRVTNERLRNTLEQLNGKQSSGRPLLEMRIQDAVDAPTILLEPDSEETSAQSALQPQKIRFFPFLFGRRSDLAGIDVFAKNHLLIGDTAPYRVSRNHCAIELRKKAFFVLDRGSQLGTIVNGIKLGGNSHEKSIRLSPGKNSLILGGPDSAIRFTVTVAR